MPKINFIFDKERDLWNIHRVCNWESPWHKISKGMPQKVLDIAKGKTFEECKAALEENYKSIHESQLILIFLKAVKEAWDKIGDEYFKRLEEITKRPICSEEFTAELTTMGSCPYDPSKNSFMIDLFSSIPHAMKTIGHEIMHMQVHKYFWKDIEKEMGNDKTHDLKEALTVLLNFKFKDLWFVEDKGYDSHQELRKFIAEEWKKSKDFDIVLKESVKFIKSIVK